MKELKHTITVENTGYLQNIFLPTGKKWQSTEMSNLPVMESGEKALFMHQIIDDIHNAQKLLMLCLKPNNIEELKFL